MFQKYMKDAINYTYFLMRLIDRVNCMIALIRMFFQNSNVAFVKALVLSMLF